MAARDILKNFNLFVDGRGYAGNVSEYTPPNLAVQTEDHRAGGMDAPIALDMGMEGLRRPSSSPPMISTCCRSGASRKAGASTSPRVVLSRATMGQSKPRCIACAAR